MRTIQVFARTLSSGLATIELIFKKSVKGFVFSVNVYHLPYLKLTPDPDGYACCFLIGYEINFLADYDGIMFAYELKINHLICLLHDVAYA